MSVGNEKRRRFEVRVEQDRYDRYMTSFEKMKKEWHDMTFNDWARIAMDRLADTQPPPKY